MFTSNTIRKTIINEKSKRKINSYNYLQMSIQIESDYYN